MKLVKDTEGKILDANNVSDKEAEDAFKTILTWLGEDPNREGLLETPKRVMKAYKEYFSGYKVDPDKILDKTFGDVDGYDDMVLEKNISFENSAISVNDTIKYLYRVNDTKFKYYDEHIKGITSFDIKHLIKHGVSKSHIIKQHVSSISIDKLLRKYSFNQLDLLFIDTEGYDGEIVNDFLSINAIGPCFISPPGKPSLCI